MSPDGWDVAADLPARLVELRDVLGDTVLEFAKRFGRGENQYYQWIKGAQFPPRRVLVQTAEAHGWPPRIFAEGGPRPRKAVNRPVNEPKRIEEPRLPYNAAEKLDGLLEGMEFDATTAAPDVVLHAASVWIATRMTTGPIEDRIQLWLQQVFEAGRRAGREEGARRGTG